jgi:hypothetical protein
MINSLQEWASFLNLQHDMAEISNRTLAAERCVPSTLKRINDALDRTVHSQAGSDESSYGKDHVERFDVPPLSEEAADPAFHAVIDASRSACACIKALVFSDGIALDLEA